MSAKALKQLMPVWAYTVVAFVLGTLSYDRQFTWRQNLTLVISGILSWMLIEYGLHRFIFHYNARSTFGRRLIYAAHMAHHENPRATRGILSGFVLSAPVAAVYGLLLYVTTRSAHIASYLLIGVAVGYITYQLLHYQAHHRKPRLRILRYLQAYHLLHHYRTPDLRFGVTTPVIDLAFGTFRPVTKRFSSS